MFTIRQVKNHTQFLKKSNSKVTFDLPCSSSGLTLISYSLESYLSSVPSWIQINSTSGELNITSPFVSEDSEFSFYIGSTINGVANPINKIIKLTVINCLADK